MNLKVGACCIGLPCSWLRIAQPWSSVGTQWLLSWPLPPPAWCSGREVM